MKNKEFKNSQRDLFFLFNKKFHFGSQCALKFVQTRLSRDHVPEIVCGNLAATNSFNLYEVSMIKFSKAL